MIGFADDPRATVGTISWDWETNATGGRVIYYSHDYCRGEKAPPDPCKNPKNWALWFREFLMSIIPQREEHTVCAKEPIRHLRQAYRCRSGTIPIREWKMKNWIQALA